MQLLRDGIELGHYRCHCLSELRTSIVDVGLYSFVVEGSNDVGIRQSLLSRTSEIAVHSMHRERIRWVRVDLRHKGLWHRFL